VENYNNIISQNFSQEILIEDFEIESALYCKIVDALPDLLYITDIQQMRKIYSNAQTHNLFKMGRKEINDMGARFFEKIIHPADQYKYFESMDSLRKAKDNQVDELQYRVIDHEGKIHWLVTRCKVFKRDEFGRPLYVLGISQNITAQVQLNAKRQIFLDEQVQINAEKQQQLLNNIINAQEEERRNIAENLHNEIGQLLFAAQLRLGAEEDESRSLINKAIKKVRQISFELTPVLLTDMGLEVALKDMLERKLDKHNIHFNFSFNINKHRLNSNIEVVIYRIVQELLNNTIKHADASQVNVLVLQKGEELYISQTDNGKGMETAVLSDLKKGFGLKSVVNRINLLNGVFEVFSTPDKGTKILMNIPLNGSE